MMKTRDLEIDISISERWVSLDFPLYYIDDFIDALILSVNKEGIYNIGSGCSFSVEEIIKIILDKANIKKEYKAKNIVRENEILDVVADITKVKNELQWQPKTKFEKGIEIYLRKYIEEKPK